MLRFTRHGTREMLIGSIVLAVVAIGLGLAWWPLALVIVPVLAWLFAFFRDPEREIPLEQNTMVSPADGKVSDISEVDHDELLGGPAVRVGIFLSVFNVHVNRSPCDCKVLKVEHKSGRFINALRHDQASEQNEAKTVVLAEPASGRAVAVVKLIVGMIKFGSRTELSIAKWLEPEVRVKVGDNVRGGADVIAVLKNPLHTVVKQVDDEEFEPLVGRETPA